MNSKELEWVARPWGGYRVMYQARDYWTKLITVNPGESLSLQLHENRAEYWLPLDFGLRGVINGSIIKLEPGTRYDIMKKTLHRVTNHGQYAASFIEVATGLPDEDDIIRIQDKYGR